jgi:hypothetical protein
MSEDNKQFAGLHQALTDYFAAISLQKTPNPPSLTEAIKNLDESGQRHLSEAPAMLRHYIEKKSYEKALQFLEDSMKESQAKAPN